MRNQLLPAFSLSLSLLIVGCTTGEKKLDPYNEVVIMLDGSISYKARRVEAINRALTLLDSIAQTKVRRWEQSTDKIAIITVDAVPEVIWQGSIRDLKALKQSDWTERFKHERTMKTAQTLRPHSSWRLRISWVIRNP